MRSIPRPQKNTPHYLQFKGLTIFHHPLVSAFLQTPLQIDVEALAQHLGYRYRGPVDNRPVGPNLTSEFILNDTPKQKTRVLLFDGNTESGFTKISSEYSAEELAALLYRLPDYLAEPLLLALRHTPLDPTPALPSPRCAAPIVPPNTPVGEELPDDWVVVDSLPAPR